MLLRLLQRRRICLLRLGWVRLRRLRSALVHIFCLRVLSRWALKIRRPSFRYRLVHHPLSLVLENHHQNLRPLSQTGGVLLDLPVRRRLMRRLLHLLITTRTKMLKLSLLLFHLSNGLCTVYFAVS